MLQIILEKHNTNLNNYYYYFHMYNTNLYEFKGK